MLNPSADTVNQLLVFSRRQIIQIKIIDINHLIVDLDKILHPMISENIKIEKSLEEGIFLIKADPSQIEQILINLIINAMDAVNQKTGKIFEKKITLKTKNIVLDKEYVKNHKGSSIGKYVIVSISDNGIGMDKKTSDMIFDPFYTTKEQGKKTGLGLSTVYGIVKQNHGFIHVESEKEIGTTFKIYWPSLDQGYNEEIKSKGLD